MDKYRRGSHEAIVDNPSMDLLENAQQAGRLLLKREEYKARLKYTPPEAPEARYDACKAALISLLFDEGRIDFLTASELVRPRIDMYVNAFASSQGFKGQIEAIFEETVQDSFVVIKGYVENDSGRIHGGTGLPEL